MHKIKVVIFQTGNISTSFDNILLLAINKVTSI